MGREALGPADADASMAASCRINTFGFLFFGNLLVFLGSLGFQAAFSFYGINWEGIWFSMKKLMLILLAGMFLFSVCMTPLSAALADTGSAVPVNQAALRQLRYEVSAANLKIDLLVFAAKLTFWNDVPLLQLCVDRIVKNVFSFAARNGLSDHLVCEYVEHMIDGQRVKIDPLKVINY